MGNWSELPEDILDQCLTKILSVESFVCSGSVCKSWRFVASKKKISSFAPWLILTKRENDTSSSENSVGHRTFFSFSSKKLFNIQLLEEAQGRRCWGSPYGWLVTMGLDRNIHLLNPLSKIQLSLPSQRTFPRDLQDGFRKPETLCQVFLHKFALSSNPSFSNQSCVVMTIYGGINRVAFAAPGDEAWTPVKRSPLGNAADIISFNGHFYAVNTYGYLSICELSTKTPHTIDIAPPPFDVECTSTYKFYLMEISGVLHLIVRNLDADDPDGCPDYFYDSESTDDFEFDDNASTGSFDSNDNASTDDIDSDDNSSTDGLDSDDNASNDDFETGPNGEPLVFDISDDEEISETQAREEVIENVVEGHNGVQNHPGMMCTCLN
ncbi:hypothetical protein IFM89_015512 [Coptis chinensis]|uniref:KIB1-4 beta-propeller domain-containing protein n=1 Tax=Coptis chinensis TaxID=261450 RepID=A0A835GWF5_9MAGN|nr:hypothetical protein IFM89_015512 [Coptis chinensis]